MGFRRSHRQPVARIVAGTIRALRVAARFFAVPPQVFEQAPQERLVSCQACCQGGAGVSSELIELHLPIAAFEGSATTEGHFYTPTSDA